MKLPLLLTTALLASGAYAQDAKPLSIAKVPLRADAPVLFAPRGWKIEKTVRGDLNRDKIADAALVLVEDKPAKDKDGYATARQRALVVLLKTGKGWTRAGFNNSLLLGTRDGGAFWGVVETPVDVSIVKGVLRADFETGSREITDTTCKFRYDAGKKGFYFIGFEQIDHDRLSGEASTTSINYLTGVKIVKTFRADNDDKGKTVKTKVSRKLRTLELVKVDELYSG